MVLGCKCPKTILTKNPVYCKWKNSQITGFSTFSRIAFLCFDHLGYFFPEVNKVALELESFGAVCIEGAKWCGKTWTSRHHANSAIYLGDPSGNFQNRELIKLAPEAALDGEVPRLIDEWQEVEAYP
jgi:hypothetical protein